MPSPYHEQHNEYIANYIRTGLNRMIEISQSFRERWPKVKVLCTSGYTADTVVRYGVETAADAILQKPFTPVGLAIKVRQTLDIL